MHASPLYQHNHQHPQDISHGAPMPAEAVSELVHDAEADAQAERLARSSRCHWVYTPGFGLALCLVCGVGTLCLMAHLAARLWRMAV